MTRPIHVFSTRAVQGALPGLISAFEHAAGAQVAVDLGPTNAMLTRIKGGELADIAILSREGIDELAEAGILDGASSVDLVRSVVGLAVKAGAPRPDIGTAEALKGTLLAAHSICYSGLGASGGLFGKLIKQLGIAEAVNAKATIIPTGLTGELVARGEVQMAVQQVSELRAVPGIDVVGPLPATLQTPTVFAAAIFAGSARAEAASALLRALASAEAATAFRAAGLEPLAGESGT
ncbi:MAG TPA: substrate-binding domain-containing protein [Hyphomicrobiaceae bacterium]|jgi:molybdate transport system substrate-binding protein|nr:substrate-binding domain-containing protein [Hyphomicrobiaceae bacterium]